MGTMRMKGNCGIGVLVLAGFLASIQNTHALNANHPFRQIEESEDVAWLERIASSLQEARELFPHIGGDAKDLRSMAYIRLGALGSPESLAAVERVETEARKIPFCAEGPTVAYLVSTHPVWHFYDSGICGVVDMPGNWGIAGPGGSRYDILCSGELGADDFFLSMTSDELNGSWMRPRLIPEMPRETWIRSSSMDWADVGILKFSYLEQSPSPSPVPAGRRAFPGGAHTLEISVSDTLRDTDGDGWTDAEEERLGLDPCKVDSDGDGVMDGADSTPNYVPPAGVETNEEVIVIQKAFFTTFGLSGSRYLLIVNKASMKIPVWGYAGPVLYDVDPGEWRENHGYGGVFVGWKAEIEGDSAKVHIHDWEASLAASSQTFLLKKIGGRWIVVGREIGPVS